MLYNNHESFWIRKDNGRYKVGLSLQEDSDITFVDIKNVGEIAIGEALLQIETSKATSEYYSPLAGKVTKINEKLLTEPQNLKSGDIEKNWIAVLENVSEEA